MTTAFRLAATLAAVLVASGFAPPLSAQTAAQGTRDQALKDLTKLQIVVENLAPAAAKCGVRQADIGQAFTVRLGGSPLQIVSQDAAKDDPQVVTVYIRAAVMSFQLPGLPEPLCVTHFDVKLFDYQKLVLAATKRETFGSVELWEKSAMLSSDEKTHGKAVYDAVAEKASDLVAAWRADNPGK